LTSVLLIPVEALPRRATEIRRGPQERAFFFNAECGAKKKESANEQVVIEVADCLQAGRRALRGQLDPGKSLGPVSYGFVPRNALPGTSTSDSGIGWPMTCVSGHWPRPWNRL